MKTVLIILLAQAFLFAQKVNEKNGQNFTGSQFSIFIEPLHFQNVEALLSGKRNSGIGLNIAPQWQFGNSEEAHTIYLAMGIAFASTSVQGDEGSFFPYLKLQYEYEHKIFKTSHSDLFVGGFAKADYRMARYPAWDDSHGYWADFFGIGLISKFEAPMDEERLWYVEAQLPVAGYNNRPQSVRNYKMDDPSVGGIIKLAHKDLKFATFKKYFNPSFEFGIDLNSSLKTLYYKVEYLYAEASYSKPYKQINHCIGAGVNF